MYVLARLFQNAWLWSAYWRLYPLWNALRQAVPEIELPPEPGMRWNIRYRLHRRVIEIRDAQLVLRPYSSSEVAGLAAAEARESHLAPDRTAVVVEAAVIVSSLHWHVLGSARLNDRLSEAYIGAMPENDIRAEAARLILVCHAVRRSRIVRQTAGPPPTRITCFRPVAIRPRRHSSLSGRGAGRC